MRERVVVGCSPDPMGPGPVCQITMMNLLNVFMPFMRTNLIQFWEETMNDKDYPYVMVNLYGEAMPTKPCLSLETPI